jgi:hypothetical protein
MPSLIDPEDARRIAAEIDEIARRLNLGEAMEAVKKHPLPLHLYAELFGKQNEQRSSIGGTGQSS